MNLRPTVVLLLAFALLMPVDVLAQTKDDTLVYALQSDVQTWDPPNSVLRESIILGYHVFDHLAARDLKTGKVGPSLAVSWKNVDDTTWEVKLRPSVKFHDGTPFSAKDVKATFERVVDPNLKLTYRATHIKIKSVEIVDDLTVRFKTDGPYPLFVERLTAQVMQSEKAIREKGHEWLQENPRRDRALQAREVEQEAGAPARPQRRLLGPQAGLQVRARADHPRAGHADRRAHLGWRRRHQGGAARSDGRHQQVRPSRARRPPRSCARASSSWTRRDARARTPSRIAACGSPPTWRSTSTRSSST